MHKHLDLTTQEAVARLQRNWTADVAAYDEIHEHILHMSDLLSAGHACMIQVHRHAGSARVWPKAASSSV